MTSLLSAIRALDEKAQTAILRDAIARDDRQMQDLVRIASPAVYAKETTPDGELRAVRERDESGRAVTKYYGDSKAWRAQFDAPGIRCRLDNPRTPYVVPSEHPLGRPA